MFDTNIISYFIKGSFPALKDNFLKHGPEEFAISALVCAELFYGVKKKGNKAIEDKLHNVLGRIKTIDFDSNAAESYAEIRTALETSGRPLENMDVLIAASAMAAGATLVTHNMKHFSMIRGLKVEDWC
ncbi:MAG: PIN domain-containing protein [Spirochaetaceae bacterium]|jgi:tRNA(fMet)-specific endonuclease VapC|nr:PIN domain-containing protein [Spirochaetaceae bacterium]